MNNKKAFPFVLLLGLLYGLNLVFNRGILGQIEPVTLTAIRLCLGALVCAVGYLLLPGRRIPTNPGLWLRAGVWGILGTALAMAMFVSALQFMSSGVESLVSSVNPILTLWLAYLLLQDELLNKKKIAGALVALVGAVVIMLRGGNGLGEITTTDWRGYALLGTGMLASSFSVIYARLYLKDEDSLDVSTIRMIVGGLALAVYVAFTGGFDISGLQVSGYLVLIYLTLIGGVFTFFLELVVIQRYGAVVNSQVSYVIPVVATGLGAVFLGEQVTPMMVAGMAGIFAGLRLMN